MEDKPAVTLTDKYIKAITPPAAGQEMYRDAALPGFGLRVSKKDAKTWVVQRRVHGKPRRIKIGRFPALSLADARNEARRIMGLIDNGKDPVAEARRQREAQQRTDARTFKAMRERFLAEYCDATRANGSRQLKQATRTEYARVLGGPLLKHLDPRPITEITDDDIIVITNKMRIKVPYSANQMHVFLRKFFNWCITVKVLTVSPLNKIPMPAEEVPRDRVLNARELFHLWNSFDAAPVFARPLKQLLVTAQRRSEVSKMETGELENLDGAEPLWTIPAHRAKNGSEHAVPLSRLAVELIGAPADGFVYSTRGGTAVVGFSKAKDAINARLAKQAADADIDTLLGRTPPRKSNAVQPWRIHDFRRTAATCMAELGVSRDVVELILNHKSGLRAGVAGIYNRSELMDDRRLALDTWARFLERITAKLMSDQEIAALRVELKAEYRRKMMGDWQQPVLRIVQSAAA